MNCENCESCENCGEERDVCVDKEEYVTDVEDEKQEKRYKTGGSLRVQ